MVIKFGWIRQKPDIRDFSPEDEPLRQFYKAIPLPSSTDLRTSFGPIIDQGAYGTCTANALDGVFNFLRLKSKKTLMNLSRAFIIRNSWGTGWGIKGYGFIQYQYLISGLMADGWNILTEEMP